MLKSSLCGYSNAYILLKGSITVPNKAAAAEVVNNGNKNLILKNCARFTDCIREINNTQVDSVKDIDLVIPMYNLIDRRDNYLKTSRNLWQYCREKPAVDNNGTIIVFNEANVTDSFNFNQRITGQTENNGTKNVEMGVPLKYSSNFWRTLETSLSN